MKVERYAAREALKRGAFAEIASRKEADRRIAAQWPEEKKIAGADFIIDNSGPRTALEVKVDGLMKQLKALAATKEG